MKKKIPAIKSPHPKRLFSGFREYDPSALTRDKRDNKGKCHASGEPAVRFDDGAEEWWTHGRLQSQDDFPALSVMTSNSGSFTVASFRGCALHEQVLLLPNTQVWCEDGFIHRDNAPAVIHSGDEFTSCEEWWVKGLRHRVENPAYTSKRFDLWYEHGLLHRTNGPAILVKLNDKQSEVTNSSWYWHGEKMVEYADFIQEFDYASADPEFALNAFAYIYEHVGKAAPCEKAILRGSSLYPDLGVLLNATSGDDSSGQFVANSICDFLSGKTSKCEILSIEGLLDQ